MQLSDEVSSEQARQTRRHSASDDNRNAVLSRRLVQLAQRPNVVNVVRGGDHRNAVYQELDRRPNLRATVSKYRNIAIRRLGHCSPRVDRGHFATGGDKVESLRNPFTGDAADRQGRCVSSVLRQLKRTPSAMLWRSPTSAAYPQCSGKCACQQDRRNRPTDEFHSLSMFDRTPNRNVSVSRSETQRRDQCERGVSASYVTYLAIGLGFNTTDQQRRLRWLTRSSTQCHRRFTTDRSTPSSRSPLRPPGHMDPPAHDAWRSPTLA